MKIPLFLRIIYYLLVKKSWHLKLISKEFLNIYYKEFVRIGHLEKFFIIQINYKKKYLLYDFVMLSGLNMYVVCLNNEMEGLWRVPFPGN